MASPLMADSAFMTALAKHAADDLDGRSWVFVPYDQLTDAIGPLSRLKPGATGIVLVECPGKAARRPYHKQKLALILANLRHFALEQARRGVAVRHLVAEGSYADALAEAADELGPLRMMRAAERELRKELQPLVDDGRLEVEEHEGFLATIDDLDESHPDGAPWRMDRFYRHMRKKTGLLMNDEGKPVGGKLSYDAENRKAWKGAPKPPALPRFRIDDIRREVGGLIEERFGDHPGELDLGAIPATRKDARKLWDWFLGEALPNFGDFQDAMARAESNLFHSRVSTMIHLHRLLPIEVCEEVVAGKGELSAREGFLRQVLGWREFMRLVHEATDGFRDLPEGFETNALEADLPLPQALWGDHKTGLDCLDVAVADVWREGYGHHIARLMVISNIATLIGVSPRELSDWFWCAYTDAFDWVVEPNVLGMGTFSLGELMTTKPYVSGANYIAKMSDYCGDCRFDPKKTCPLTSLYWAFLARHADRLEGNQRVAMPLRNLAKRDAAKKKQDAALHRRVVEFLGAGEELPADLLVTSRPARD